MGSGSMIPGSEGFGILDRAHGAGGSQPAGRILTEPVAEEIRPAKNKKSEYRSLSQDFLNGCDTLLHLSKPAFTQGQHSILLGLSPDFRSCRAGKDHVLDGRCDLHDLE